MMKQSLSKMPALVFVVALAGNASSLGAQTTDSNWRDSEYVQALHEEALREGQITILGFDTWEVNWLAAAIPDVFPGIEVNTRAALGNLSLVMAMADSPQPILDLVLTSMLEANALHEGGYLAPVDWNEFGVAESRYGLDGHFGYSGNIVYTLAYDTRRVPGETSSQPIPSEWRDLLEPEYRGRMGTNPFIMPRLLGALGIAWGEQEVHDFARSLADNQDLLLQFGDSREVFLNPDRPQMYFLGMVHTATEEWQNLDRPTRYVIPEPVLMEQRGPAVMASAPHPAAARLIAGWMASEEGKRTRRMLYPGSDLLPDSDDELARELRARDTVIVYDTPEDIAQRTNLTESLQPLFDDLYRLNAEVGPR